MSLGEKLFRSLYAILGLFLLLVVLLNLFFVPVNTSFECWSPKGNCKIEEKYFFYARNHQFDIKDIIQKKLVSIGGSYYRTYSLHLDTPEFSFVAGKYRSEPEAKKMLAVVGNFQTHPTGKLLYINEDGYIDHIFVTIGGFLIVIFFCWMGICPPKSFKWV